MYMRGGQTWIGGGGGISEAYEGRSDLDRGCISEAYEGGQT